MKYKRGDRVHIKGLKQNPNLPKMLDSTDELRVIRCYPATNYFYSLLLFFRDTTLFSDLTGTRYTTPKPTVSILTEISKIKYWFKRETVYALEWYVPTDDSNGIDRFFFLEKESRLEYVMEQKREIKIQKILE